MHLKPYTTSRTKLRNYLSNISHSGITKENFYKGNFSFDIYILLTKNLNFFSLDRKLSDENKHKMIYMLWKECIQGNFYKFICKEGHFLHINGKKMFCTLLPGNLSVKMKKKYNQLRNNLCQYKKIFQFVYSIVCPEIYCTAEH